MPPSPSNADEQHPIRKWLNDHKYKIYGMFGLAAISDARNLTSWFFEAVADPDETPSDTMHDWLSSPVGIIFTCIQTLLLVAFAIIGGAVKETDKKRNAFFRGLAFLWPYVRDSIKALKNGYKAARSLIFFCVAFGAAALTMSSILLPLGLGLGVLYLLNRIWYRSTCSERRKMQTMNDDLEGWESKSIKKRQKCIDDNPLLEQALKRLLKAGKIKALTDTLTNEQWLRLIHHKQTKEASIKCYASAAFNGLLDGLYLYAGLYALSYLIPPLAILVNVFSILFVTLAVVRNVYEEACYQRKLELSACKSERACLASIPNRSQAQEKRLLELDKRVKKLETFTFRQALGESVRNGLGIYSALTGITFAISIFTPVPFFVVFIVIGCGVLGLIGAACQQLYQYHKWNEKKGHPENKFPDATELGRSAGAGIRQGDKISRFALNDFQEKDAQGHYHRSPIILIVSYVLSAIFAVVYILRALVKGFARGKNELSIPYSNSTTNLDPDSPRGGSKPPSSEDMSQSPKATPSSSQKMLEELTDKEDDKAKKEAMQELTPAPSPDKAEDLSSDHYTFYTADKAQMCAHLPQCRASG